MKPCHAAALALIGWYLIAPPIRNGRILGDAPLKEWNKLGFYKHLNRCERQKRIDSKPTDWVAETQQTLQLLRLEQCIASNDPRLKP
jgi:hypothetical protein